MCFTDSAPMHHSVKPHVRTPLVVNPSLPSLRLYTCISVRDSPFRYMRRDYSSLHEFGLVMCVPGRGKRPQRAPSSGCSVSLLADMLTFTAPPPPLCRSHRLDADLQIAAKIPEQYQFAQPAHGERGIRHTHARADLQRIAVECTSMDLKRT